MPKIAKELSAIAVKNLKYPEDKMPPGGKGNPHAVAVGGVTGLYLQLTPNGAKSWILRTMVNGKRHAIGLGSYQLVKLAKARELAADKLIAIKYLDADPIAERKAKLEAQRKVKTVAQVVAEYVASGKLDELNSDKHRANWISSLERYVVKLIGDQPVGDVDVPDVLRVLTQDTDKGEFWQGKTDTASRVRLRLETVLDWATFKGYRAGDNPARWKGNLEHTLPKPGKVAKTTHKPAVQLDDAARWFAAVHEREGSPARALEFIALTAARSGEVRGANWDEVDLERGMWVIPAERMKMEREHRVPLPAAAVALLEALPNREGLLFEKPSGGPLYDYAISGLMKRMHEADEQGFMDGKNPAVPHGLRSTFRDWAAERTNYPRDMAEMALAHREGDKVERAYLRSDMVAKRRAMMDAWADFLQGREADAKVVQIHG